MMDKKKLSKRQAASRKKEFFIDYSASILEAFGTSVKFYEHFIKIDLAGVEYDYYPGKGSLIKVSNIGYWLNEQSDVEPEDFLKMIDIPIKKDFFTEEESLFNEDNGLISGDLD